MNSIVVDTRTVAEDYVESLSRRRLASLLELFAEKVDWYIPGDTEKAGWLGRRSTKPEIEDFFKQLWVNTEPLAANIEYIFAEGEHAIIAGSFVTRMVKTGKVADSLFFVHFRCREGRIVWYRLLEDSLAVLRAL